MKEINVLEGKITHMKEYVTGITIASKTKVDIRDSTNLFSQSRDKVDPIL